MVRLEERGNAVVAGGSLQMHHRRRMQRVGAASGKGEGNGCLGPLVAPGRGVRRLSGGGLILVGVHGPSFGTVNPRRVSRRAREHKVTRGGSGGSPACPKGHRDCTRGWTAPGPPGGKRPIRETAATSCRSRLPLLPHRARGSSLTVAPAAVPRPSPGEQHDAVDALGAVGSGRVCPAGLRVVA